MKNSLFALLPLLATALNAPAQQLLQAEPQIERVLSPPLMGTFFLRQQKNGPPYPFDPFAGRLPVYEWKPGVFIVDDSQVDYPAMKSMAESGAGSAAAMSLPAPPPCESCPTNGSGGGPLNWGAVTHSSNDLWLELANITNSQAFFTIHTPDTFGSYDLFTTTNLALTTNAGGLNRSNWLWLSRTAVSQTNLVLTNLWPSQGWFQLGTMLDSDSDGLPDAFEIHVSKTNPQLRDSNGNGTADGDEMGPNGLPWALEQDRRNAVVVHASAPTAVEGGGCGQFIIHLPAPAPAGGATVQYRFGGSAVPGLEFATTPAGHTLTIPAGGSSGTILVCAVNDTELSDLDRYVEITLTNASCCAVDSRPARVTLMDNDLPAVRVFAMPQWVRKPSPTFGTNTAGFYFVRDGDSSNALTANVSLSGSAESGVDFDALPGSVYFPANVRTNLLPVILKPTTNVSDRTLTLTITSVLGHQIDPTMGSGTIMIASSTLTPVPVVQVTATDDDAREAGLNTGQLTFTRSGSTEAPLRVFYHVNGTAAAGSPNSARDYVELPGYVDFASGAASVAVTVSPLDDTDYEIVETVVVTLAGGDYAIGSNNAATVYIDDNEPVTYTAEMIRDGVHGANASRVNHVRVIRTGSVLGTQSMNWYMSYTFTPNILTGTTGFGDTALGPNRVVWAVRQSIANAYFATTWSQQLDSTYNATLKLSNSIANQFQFTAQYHPQSFLVRVASGASPATNVLEGTTASQALIFTRPYPGASSLNAAYHLEGSAVGGVDYAFLPGLVSFSANSGGPITVAVQAYANAQTNGWKTAAVTIDHGTTQVGDAGLDRAFFRIQDAQISNPTFDTDMDDDGLSDGWELGNQSDGYDPLGTNNAYADTDRDGLALFQEIQLGTNPNLPDAQPVYPSEDQDDYVTLTLRLGAKGKLADEVGCAVCHSVGLRAGPHSRTTPRTSWDNIDNGQNHLLRFLRGTNYPVRLMDNPYSKVLASGQTNNAVHAYTAAYTAQFLNGTNAPYTLVTDTNQLFGTNRPMVLEALARAATVFVPDLIIAADVDRNGVVNPTNRADRTSPNAPLVFWINDDSDFGSDDMAEDRDPTVNALNRSNTSIDGLRDLEDFTRLQFRVEGLPGNMLTNAGMQTRIYITNLSGTPSLRLFRAVETNGGATYLTNEATAIYQLAMGAFGAVTNGSPLTLTGSEWKAAGSNRFFLPTLFEGTSTGTCVVVFAIASNTGPDVAVSRPFYLELRRVTDLYEHWTVGDSHTLPWDQIANRAARTADSAVFGPAQRQEEFDYILFVHGWRMLPWERRAFASTAFKRLWHLHHRGRFGLFSWPTDWVENPLNLTELQNYDRSERRAWHSALGLERLLIELNRNHPDRVRVMAHSMGNVVVSEALRLKGLSVRRPVLHSYAASQAASVAHAYDAVNSETTETDFTAQTPEVYARYPLNGLAYFSGMTNSVRFDATRNTRNIWNFHNRQDFALSAVSWSFNQDAKPDNGWTFEGQTKSWRRTLVNAEGPAILEFQFQHHAYEIYSHIAESRSLALGAAEANGFFVRGQIGDQVDLNFPPFSYADGRHEHSAQFRSIIMRRNSYWSELLTKFEITP